MIRLYGQLSGSFRTVSEGLKEAFEELGVLSGYVIGERQDFDEEPVPGADAPIAVVVGEPLRVKMACAQGMHQEVWLMLAPNSEGVPLNVLQQLDGLVTGLLAPSKWAQEVLQRSFPKLPVKLCQHGVLRSIRRVSDATKLLDAVHITSSRLSRKGTRQLITAWNMSSFQSQQLYIFINPQWWFEYSKLVDGIGNISLMVGQNLTWEEQSLLYSRARVVIQPSRAEGFGLVPLEALTCGTPVITTNCTGQKDYLPQPGFVDIEVGPDQESDDYWGAKAPSLDSGSILAAMDQYYSEKDVLTQQAQENADSLAETWTWANGARQLVEEWKNEFRGK